MHLRHYLLVFDGRRGRLKQRVRIFRNVESALREYEEAEARYGKDAAIQVVLVSADSLDTVKATHPNFWRSMTFEELAHHAFPAAAGK